MLAQFLDRGLPLSGMNPDMCDKDLTDDDLRSILRVACTPSAAEDQATTKAQRKLYKRKRKATSKWVIHFENGAPKQDSCFFLLE